MEGLSEEVGGEGEGTEGVEHRGVGDYAAGHTVNILMLEVKIWVWEEVEWDLEGCDWMCTLQLAGEVCGEGVTTSYMQHYGVFG